MIQRLKERIAKQLAEFRQRNTELDYEEQARIIVLIVNEERLAEIREWRQRRLQKRVQE
jgi:regulator of PEP synthase PpsR (kinase-PPPase family)